MKKKLLILIYCVWGLTYNLCAENIFFTSDRQLTPNCRELFDALNFPQEIVNADSCVENWENHVLDFLYNNSWLDGEYPTARGKNVNFDKVIKFLEKTGIILEKIPSKTRYDYIVVMSNNGVEAIFNDKFFRKNVGPLLFTGDISCRAPIIILQNGQNLLSMRDSRWACRQADSYGTMYSFIENLWNQTNKQFNLHSEFIHIPFLSKERTAAVDVLSIIMNGHEHFIKPSGHLLIVSSSGNLSQKEDLLKAVIKDANIISIDIVGYEVSPYKYRQFHNIEPLTQAIFSKLSDVICDEYNSILIGNNSK